jgi:hypothetical protein
LKVQRLIAPFRPMYRSSLERRNTCACSIWNYQGLTYYRKKWLTHKVSCRAWARPHTLCDYGGLDFFAHFFCQEKKWKTCSLVNCSSIIRFVLTMYDVNWSLYFVCLLYKARIINQRRVRRCGFQEIHIYSMIVHSFLPSFWRFSALLRLSDLCTDQVLRGAIPAPAVFQTIKALHTIVKNNRSEMTIARALAPAKAAVHLLLPWTFCSTFSFKRKRGKHAPSVISLSMSRLLL